MLIALLLSFRLFEARSPVCVASFVFRFRGAARLVFDDGSRAHVKQSGSAWRFDLVELSGARRRDSELRQVVICDPSFVFRFRGVTRLVFEAAHVHVKQSRSAWRFHLVAWWGVLDVVLA